MSLLLDPAFKQQYKKILKDQSNENIVNNCNLGKLLEKIFFYTLTSPFQGEFSVVSDKKVEILTDY